jgi:hypothetical protein
MTKEDYYNKCLGKSCHRIGLYHPIYPCREDTDIFCSRRMEFYDTKDSIILDNNPYCRPLWGKQNKIILLPDSEEKIMLELPMRMFSLLSHSDNIKYALEQLQNNDKVIGFYKRRMLGVRERFHHIIRLEDAEKIKELDDSFDYITLDKIVEAGDEK